MRYFERFDSRAFIELRHIYISPLYLPRFICRVTRRFIRATHRVRLIAGLASLSRALNLLKYIRPTPCRFHSLERRS